MRINFIRIWLRLDCNAQTHCCSSSMAPLVGRAEYKFGSDRRRTGRLVRCVREQAKTENTMQTRCGAKRSKRCIMAA
jgi:hypothetical protein